MVNIISLDFCTAFNKIPRARLAQRVIYGIQGELTNLMQNWCGDWRKMMMVEDLSCDRNHLIRHIKGIVDGKLAVCCI